MFCSNSFRVSLLGAASALMFWIRSSMVFSSNRAALFLRGKGSIFCIFDSNVIHAIVAFTLLITQSGMWAIVQL